MANAPLCLKLSCVVSACFNIVFPFLDRAHRIEEIFTPVVTPHPLTACFQGKPHQRVRIASAEVTEPESRADLRVRHQLISQRTSGMGCCASSDARAEAYKAESKVRVRNRQATVCHALGPTRLVRLLHVGASLPLQEPGAQQASKAAETASKAAEAQPASAGHPQISNYKPKKPKLDPKDFQFVGLKGEVKVKPPG